MDDRNDGFPCLQRERNFVHDICGFDRIRGENHDQAGAGFQGIFDRAVPPLTGNDIQLIQPNVCTSCLQVCSEPNYKTGIVPAIAEKCRWRTLCHEWSLTTRAPEWASR